jgi:hemolysin III
MRKEGDREFSRGEELANAISHLTGAGLATAGLALMSVFSAIRGNAWHVVSTAIFGSTMILVYLASTLAHWLRPGKGKEFFFQFDHIAIFLLIAGTYTPMTLVVLHGALGWTIFGSEWGMAVLGIILKFSRWGRTGAGVNLLFIALYATMGWMFIIAIVPIIKTLPLMGFLWILIGGLCYTIGILFYRVFRFPYHHLVWHLLVIAGSISHWFGIFFFIIPSQ